MILTMWMTTACRRTALKLLFTAVWTATFAQIIYKELGAGIQTTGQKVVEVITASGATKAIHFNRPHPVPVYVKVVGLSTSGDFPHDGVDQLRAAIVAYIGDTKAAG